MRRSQVTESWCEMFQRITQEAAVFTQGNTLKLKHICCSTSFTLTRRPVEQMLTPTPTWCIFLAHVHAFTFMKPTCFLSSERWWQRAVHTYTIVAAPASNSVGRISHLLQGLGAQVAQLPQAAVVEHPSADPAGVQVVGRPHLTHVTHLIAGRLR